MKRTFTLLTALLLAPLTAPMNFQGLETVRLPTFNDWT
jgi:hypothetical protein